MVRPSERRKEKYDAKVDGDITAKHTKALKPSMVREEAKYFSEISELEKKVKALVEAEGVSTIQVRDYLNFGRELYTISKRFSDVTMNAEAQLRVNKWKDRGLNSTLLVKIAFLLGLDPSPAPTPTQEVDVTDRENRELGKTTVKNFPSEYPLPNAQVLDLKSVEADVINFPSTYPLPDAQVTSLRDVSDRTSRELGKVRQDTRTLFKAQTEREDLISLGGVASPNNAGVLIVSGTAQQKIKVYDAGFHAGVDGLHYFYFGTSTVATSKRFCTINKALPIHKTFVQPRVGDVGDGLYLFSSVAETNMPYDVGYVKE